MRIGTTQEGEIGTVVGANVRLVGTLKDTNDITVHGTVEGEVVSDKTVNITESAIIKGPITAQVVIIAGTVKGGIDGKSKIEILSSGRVSGSTSTTDLIIHGGAVFNGKSTMPESSEAKATSTKSSDGEEGKKETAKDIFDDKKNSDFELE